MLIIPAWRRATAPIASSVGAGIGETRHGMGVPPPRGPSTCGRGPGKGTTEAGQLEALALRRKEQPDAPSAGLGARLLVLLQPAQHDAAVLGQRPVLFLIDDEGDGLDAIGSRYRRPGWDARRSGQERPYANPEAARQAAHTFTAVRPAASRADGRVVQGPPKSDAGRREPDLGGFRRSMSGCKIRTDQVIDRSQQVRCRHRFVERPLP